MSIAFIANKPFPADSSTFDDVPLHASLKHHPQRKGALSEDALASLMTVP